MSVTKLLGRIVAPDIEDVVGEADAADARVLHGTLASYIRALADPYDTYFAHYFFLSTA